MTRHMTLFPLGRTVATPGALELLAEHGVSPLDLLKRHHRGDWGDIDPEDTGLNDAALRDGSRVLSAYDIHDGEKVWIITEADRSATTILLPEEY